MKTINITIEGASPILMNRFTEEAEKSVSRGSRSSLKGDKGTPREQAEPKTYKDNEGYLYIPAPNILRALIDAGKFFKIGRSKVTTVRSSLVTSFLLIQATECYLLVKGHKTKEFEVDSRSVVNPVTGGRIMAHRPRLDEWQISFVLLWDDKEAEINLVREIVDAAGSKIGLGDFRPDRKGPFGRFVVTSWKVSKK